MYSWSELLNASSKENQNSPQGGIFFLLNKKKEYLHELSCLTGRNTILYFSAFLNKQSVDAGINDKDVNALMENVHKLDKSKGLDLILHTPGGDLAATEQIIYYLNSYFNGNVRAIVPQMAMSAGSMIAVSCQSVIMGRQSCLGPFDPQLNGVACQSVIREFYNAVEDVKKNPASLGLWQTIISKLTPTFITMCQQADDLAEELTTKILANKEVSDEVKKEIRKKFTQNLDSKTHSRHINKEECRNAGLCIIDLEEDQKMQDLVLGIHHCCMILGEQSNIIKIVENNIGGTYISQINPSKNN